ncbi:MAG: hypothetical protein H8D23_29870 [Candidatus Brocadiales bacterium]|nr:hypothetical protein [Candidatus Brocadiales bacterium]
MHIVFYLLVFLLASEGLSLSDQGGEGIITLNYPPDLTVMELGLLSVSLNVPKGSVDSIKVGVNLEEEILKIVPDSEFECFSVHLEVGINIVSITAIKNRKKIDNIVFRVFLRSDLVSKYRKPPPEFKKDYFHSKDRSQCIACHTLKLGKLDKRPVNIGAFERESIPGDMERIGATSTCFSCHKSVTSYKYVHGPVAVWSCLFCHDPETEPVYSVKKPDTEVCFSCHVEQKNEWVNSKYIHGPLTMGNCSICHNPHASDNLFNLIKPSWDLCINCHEGQATGRHIIVGLYNEGHPTHGVLDPLRKGKELTCASCHNPHASNYPKLWAMNVRSQFELCMKCHKY